MSFDPSEVSKLPQKPGVYLMKDLHNEILYIGKAKKLRQRVRQYFLEGGDGREQIPLILKRLEKVEVILTQSEKEALLLENQLIKEHQPPYNVLLKDDKNFISLKITTRDKWPMIQVVRARGKRRDGLYFGPYTSGFAARETLDLMNKLFPLRQCSNRELENRERPCLLYQIKRCAGPCAKKCTEEEYQAIVDRAVGFLKGKDKEVLQDLYKMMEEASEALEFERAGLILKTIRQIEKTLEKQHLDTSDSRDIDVLGLHRKAYDLALAVVSFRGGKFQGMQSFFFQEVLQDDGAVLESFLLQHYGQKTEIPHEILVPLEIESLEELSLILTEQGSRKVQVHQPKRGKKVRWLVMARENAETKLQREQDESAQRDRLLVDLQDRLSLNKLPKRIECFDISNIAGTNQVGVMVAFSDGKKDARRYRKYNIRSVEGPDDYESMREVLRRRYKRAITEGDLPDLVLIDGGKGHLNAALQVFRELDLLIDVIGIAKESGRHDRGMTHERAFLPNQKEAIHFEGHDPLLFFIQRIRDEAHRFAITFHRKKRSKAIQKSALDSVPGIGPTKKKRLLQAFASPKGISRASDEEILAIQGISAKDLENLRTHLI